VKGIDGTHARRTRRARAAEFRDLHSGTNPGDRRGSRLLFGCIGCLGFVLLLLAVVLSQYDRISFFDGNTSSPPSLGHPGRQ
jgi:hypothetical protein